MWHEVSFFAFDSARGGRARTSVSLKLVSSDAVTSLSMEQRVELAGDETKLAPVSPGSPSTQTLQAYGRAKENGLNFPESSSRVAASASWPLSPSVTDGLPIHTTSVQIPLAVTHPTSDKLNTSI
jgi:hypothetical protein